MAISPNTQVASTSPRPKRRRSTRPRISKREAARLLALRDRLEQHLEAMIGWLNELDGDPDLEPSLGASRPHEQLSQTIWAHGTTDDREQECEDEGAGDEDSEPALGWPETGTAGQSFHNMGSTSDLEEQCEDEGAQCDDEGCVHTDDEPSLGWTIDGKRGSTWDDDREHDPADLGEPDEAF